MKLALALDGEVVAPGERLTGRVEVSEGGKSRSLAVIVRFCGRSPSYVAVPFEDTRVVHQGKITAGQAVPVEYDVPESALPSVKSEHAELYWEIEAISDEPGLDSHASRVFRVVLR